MLCGLGIGQGLTPILAHELIAAHGWRAAYAVLALLPLAVALFRATGPVMNLAVAIPSIGTQVRYLCDPTRP